MDAAYHAGGDAQIVASYVPATLAEQLTTLARQNDRSISGEIRHALREYIAASRTPLRLVANEPTL
jgi:hypothetical protein